MNPTIIEELNARWTRQMAERGLPTLGPDPLRCACGWRLHYAGPCVACRKERAA